jgi:MerR family transcriptional regulator/heat shock protein HspR
MGPGAERARRDVAPLAGLDDAAWPMYTVGQAAQLLGVQPAFLRRLDTHEVVRPARSDGGQRRYSRSQLTRISQVAGLASEGFTLQAIRRLLELEGQVNELRRQLAAEQGLNRQLRNRTSRLAAPGARSANRQEIREVAHFARHNPGRELRECGLDGS